MSRPNVMAPGYDNWKAREPAGRYGVSYRAGSLAASPCPACGGKVHPLWQAPFWCDAHGPMCARCGGSGRVVQP